VDESSFADVITVESHAHSMNVAAWVIIVVGAIIFILGFLGCCGAIRESQFMLATVIASVALTAACVHRVSKNTTLPTWELGFAVILQYLTI